MCFLYKLIISIMICFWMVTGLYAEESAKVIKRIETVGLSRVDDAELINLICNCVGRTLNMDEIQSGIRKAFLKGVFLDIKVDAEPYQDGIALKYIIHEVPVINDISIKGNDSFMNKQVSEAFLFKEGEEFREEYLDDARLSIVHFYKRKGYPEADADITVQDIGGESRVNIHVKIDEGQPDIISSVTYDGNFRYFITLSVGDIFDLDEMDEMINKIKKSYKERNYIKPEVGPYEFNDGNLYIPVNPGPQLKVEFRNRTVFSEKELIKAVTYLEHEEVSDELTEEIAERIRNLYVSKGYYHAQVASGIESGDDVINATFIIFEGHLVNLRSVSLKGVTIKEAAVRKVLSLPVNKPYNDNSLKRSRDGLIRFYHAIGYLDVNVEDIKKEFSSDGKEVDVEFHIVEGLQKRIEEIIISGNKAIDLYRIRRALKIHEGDPFNRVDIGDARYRVLALYGKKGFMNATVHLESVVKKDKVYLTFSIKEGRPSVVGKIIISGNLRTKDKVVRRELTLEQGEVYDNTQITKMKQNLYKLGIFSEVSIDPLEPVTSDDGSIVRDMLVSLKEGKAGSVEFGIGFGDYEGFRGSVDISYNNIGGYNRQAGFRSELSSVEKRFVLNFTEPWLFNKPNLPLKVFLIKEETRSVDNENRDVLYEIDKLSFIAGVEKELMKGLKVALNYEYSFTDTTDVQPGVILSKEDTGTLGIGSISTSLVYDTSDNPFDPTSGSYHGVTLKFASVMFLSETEFIKGSFQSSWFFPLHKRIVYAFSLRGGVAYSYEDEEELPLIERFFLGGRSSARGYDHDELGPKGEDDTPTGGNLFALLNNELRFNVGKGFGIVTFVDSGNVWQTFDDLSSDVKHTAGLGLRYRTPVGPVRVDYGHKLDRDPGESAGEIHFSFGHAF